MAEKENQTDPRQEDLLEEGDFSEETENTADDPILLEWDALEYMHHERGVLWYLVGGVAAILMIVYAVITQAWTMAIVVALLAGVIYLYSHETPAAHHVAISKMGIHVGRKNFHYGNLDSFWLLYEPDIQTLNIRMAGKTGNVEVIQLGEQDPIEVRETLLQYLAEESGQEEGMVDKLGRWMKV